MPDIDDPLPVATTAKGSAGPSDEQIDELVQMGFTKNQGRKALRLSVRLFPFHYPSVSGIY